MNDEDRKKDYITSASEYWRWVDAGNNLLISANILELAYVKVMEDIKKAEPYGKLPLAGQILSQIIYLKAQSLELYLKALYIKQGNLATKQDKLVKELNSHNLNTLCSLTKFLLVKNEKLLLDKLTESIKFWGRYPVPLTFARWRPTIKGIKGVQPIYIWSQSDNELLEVLLKRITDLIDIKNDKNLPWNEK